MGCDGWGAGVMGRFQRRWLGFGSDMEVQWAMGRAGVIGRRRGWWARQGISGEVYGPRCRVRDAGVIRGKTIKINIGL